MRKQDELTKGLNEKKRELEIKFENSKLLSANFVETNHRMFMGEELHFLENYPKDLAEENSQLEKVDLIDYWNYSEYGRRN